MDYSYTATTDAIEVAVEPCYLPEKSDADEPRHVWAYFIRITNHSSQTVKLLMRHWHITDATGLTNAIAGPGVVGEQPIIPPGNCYEYNSFTELPTDNGFMSGRYELVTAEGADLMVEIPTFSLDKPTDHVRLN